MKKVAQGILERNVEQRKDYLKKYQNLLQRYESDRAEQTETVESSAPETEIVKMCSRCGEVLVKRKGKYGEFYGFESPHCRYTEKIK